MLLPLSAVVAPLLLLEATLLLILVALLLSSAALTALLPSLALFALCWYIFVAVLGAPPPTLLLLLGVEVVRSIAAGVCNNCEPPLFLEADVEDDDVMPPLPQKLPHRMPAASLGSLEEAPVLTLALVLPPRPGQIQVLSHC